jgi:hypothetical protein
VALYQVLATLPGIHLVKDLSDPLGRTAVAVTDANIDVLLINSQTGQLLATTTGPVLPGSKLPACTRRSQGRSDGSHHV